MPTCPQGHSSEAADYCDVCGAPIPADQPGAVGLGSPASGAVGPATGARGAGAAAATQPCPHCGSPNATDALFCEACGYDFTTGSMPRPLTPPSGPGARAAAPAGGATAVESSAPTSDRATDATAAAATVDGPAATGSAADDGSPQATGPDAPVAWVVEMWVDPAWYASQESPDPLPSAGAPAVLPLSGRSLLVGRTSRSRNIHPDVDCGGDSGVSRRQAQLTTDGTRWWVEDLGSANGTFVGTATGALPEDPVVPGTRRELGPHDRVYVGAWTRLVVRAATDDERASFASTDG